MMNTTLIHYAACFVILCFVVKYDCVGNEIIADLEPIENTVTKPDTVNWYLLAPIATAGTGVFVYSQIKQSTVYWGDRTSFYSNFQDDWRYAHGGDKFGHAYFANVLNILTRESLINCGLNSRKAAWWGFAVSMIHQTAIEIQDGFSTGKDGSFVPYLGFSWGDFTANTLGAAFPLAQEYSPFLQNFRYKFSINPSAKYRSGNFYSSVTHDYESKYHWLSINLHDLLPKEAQRYWTPFLNLAIGHSVKDIVVAPGQYAYLNNGAPYHELWLSLDYNFEALPGNAQWWTSLKRILNLYKLPAPCVRLLPDVVWYGFRW